MLLLRSCVASQRDDKDARNAASSQRLPKVTNAVVAARRLHDSLQMTLKPFWTRRVIAAFKKARLDCS
jgi:hypothetical protein